MAMLVNCYQLVLFRSWSTFSTNGHKLEFTLQILDKHLTNAANLIKVVPSPKLQNNIFRMSLIKTQAL